MLCAWICALILVQIRKIRLKIFTRKENFLTLIRTDNLAELKWNAIWSGKKCFKHTILCTWDENQALNHIHASSVWNIITQFFDRNSSEALFLIHCLLNLDQIIFTTCDFSRVWNSFSGKAFAYHSLFLLTHFLAHSRRSFYSLWLSIMQLIQVFLHFKYTYMK